MHVIKFLVACAFALPLLASAQYITGEEIKAQQAAKAAAEKARIEQEPVGKTYWIAPRAERVEGEYPVALYKRVDEDCIRLRQAGCRFFNELFYPTRTVSFRVLRYISPDAGYHHAYEIMLEDGMTAFIEAVLFGIHANWKPDMAFYKPANRHLKIWPESPDKFDADRAAEALKEEKRAQAARRAYAKKSGAYIGMSKAEALASKWGRPQRINTTIVAGMVREQWVYASGYLYFQNGALIAIQH